MGKKIVIIGGVAGGATAAARLRRRDEEIEIVLFEKGDYISYANCGLPYYIGDVIEEREALLLLTPQAMNKKYQIDVRISSQVIEIQPENKKVVVKKTKTGETYEETYDVLLLATGSSPLRPNIPGINHNNIFTLWTVPDTDRIKQFINEHKPKTAAVIGGGFIGLEMAENLHHTGLEVTLVELQPQVMPPLDYEMARLVQENMHQNGVHLMLGDGVSKFEEANDGKVTITCNSQTTLTVDMVILSIGIRPNSELAKDAGILLNSKGGIIVDEYLRTSIEDIYAVGDVIEVNQYGTNEKTMIPLAGPANKQARICADNILGAHEKYQGSMGSAVAKVFDYTVASVGQNEKQLKEKGLKKGIDYDTVLINQKSHAGYYPNAVILTLKMIFDQKGKVIGAQIVGQDGVDKRIDTIASVMHFQGTVSDLASLELSYAPPYSSAKDPVNMLGFVAENIRSGLVSFVEWHELDEYIHDEVKQKDITILDVTETAERLVYHIPNSYHIPLGQLRDRSEELNKEKLILCYCAIGVRSYNAARILMQQGFLNVKVLSAGTAFYKSMHYDVTNNPNSNKNERGGIKEEMKRKDHICKAASIEKKETKQTIHSLNCTGLQCPGPIMKVNETLATLKDGECLQIAATDLGFASDVQSWCRRTKNTYLGTKKEGLKSIVTIQKGMECPQKEQFTVVENEANGKTIIVFSGDLDKVLASFIIANGAASMGRPVTMFFTFWGLNVLRKHEKIAVKKPVVEKMFGTMMPRGSKKLTLSRMNMGGMGTKMMRRVMNDKNIESLEDLMKTAMNHGVKLVACTMSMDVMGITKEELIDGVELAGVASYLGDAEESNVNLFI